MRIPTHGKIALSLSSGLMKNILWLVVSRFGTQGLMVAFTLVLARRLGSTAFGTYAFFAAMIFIGNALTTFGTDMLLIREIAARNDLSQLFPALVIQLGLSGGFIAVTWAVAPLIPNQTPESVLGLQIYSLALMPLAFFSVFTTALRGKQRMDSYMVLNLLVSALQLVVVWIFVRRGNSVTWLAELLVMVQCAGAVFGGLVCATQIPGFWKYWHYSWHQTASLMRHSAPIALIALIGILYQKISVYMVSTLAGPTATGWFSAGLRVIEASKTIHMAVFTALFPIMAQAAVITQPVVAEERQSHLPWQGAFKQSWLLLLAGAVAISLVIFFFAGTITQVLYGPEYAPAQLGLQLLSFILIPFTVNTFFSLVILADHREQTVMYVQLAGLATLVGLNSWLIPLRGIAGASLAFLLAETVQTLLYLSPRKIRQQNGRQTWIIFPWAPVRTRTGAEDQAQSRDSV